MYSVWTKDAKDIEEKERLQRSIQNSNWLLERLSTILDTMVADLDSSERSLKTYELPNWDYRQAHNNGYRQAISLVQKLITLDREDTNDQRPITTPDRPAAG